MTRQVLPATVRFAVWRRDGFTCTYCLKNAVTEDITLVVDHVIPVVQGGSDDPSNLTTACRDCNARKGPKPGPKQRWTRLVSVEHNVVAQMREQQGLSLEELATAARIGVEQLDAIEHEAVEKTGLLIQRRLSRALYPDQWCPPSLFSYEQKPIAVERAS